MEVKYYFGYYIHTYIYIYIYDEWKKVAAINSGNLIMFPRNETKEVIARCNDKKCKYMVYRRKLKDESTFLLVSLNPKHTCIKRYKNHMINSAWIADECQILYI